MITSPYLTSAEEANATIPAAQGAVSYSLAATSRLRGFSLFGRTEQFRMTRRETVTSRVLGALEDAEDAVRRGDTAAALQLIGAGKLEVIDLQFTIDTTIYKIQHGEAPEPPKTPWFARRARQNAELRAEIIDLDAARQRRQRERSA